MIKYPISDCETKKDKLEYLYQAQEKLRLEHNKYGKDKRDEKVTRDEWLKYLKDTFKPKSKQIGHAIAEIRETLGYSSADLGDNEPEVERISAEKVSYKKSTRYTVDLGDITSG